jgi:hypothetical protein
MFWQMQWSGLGYGMCRAQAGLEMAPNVQPDTFVYSQTFDHSPLEFYNSTSVPNYPAGWYYWNGPPNSWVDFPCGQFGYSQPKCLNGTYYQSYHWANNTGR